jgi:hypothetical protein
MGRTCESLITATSDDKTDELSFSFITIENMKFPAPTMISLVLQT